MFPGGSILKRVFEGLTFRWFLFKVKGVRTLPIQREGTVKGGSFQLKFWLEANWFLSWGFLKVSPGKNC